MDTSVINFLFAEDAPEKQEVTIDFFDNYVQTNLYEVLVSSVVVDEINKTTDEIKRSELLGVVQKFSLGLLPIEDKLSEIEDLAFAYLDAKIIPAKKLEDALHVAITCVFELDVLLSWNYKHLANIHKEARILALNLNLGYTKPFKMLSPYQLVYEQ
ncbi:MAG: hypothetical protein NW226_05655 [Microscillaceae bacterium]|nr:hypothetical protein [Microscillaceae bacterium]